MKKDLFSANDCVSSVSELLLYYKQQAGSPWDLKIGVEWERFGVYTDTLKVVPYSGNKGYLKILQYLHTEKGWEIEDSDGDNIFTLLRSESRITVEGDGKPEISASPHMSLHDLAEEITRHSNEIEEISKKLGISWIPLGIQPFVPASKIPLVPKKRYLLWDRIFPNHHDWMHTYMKALAGVHINFDYTSEKDLIRKAKLLLVLSPIMAAMFANSPFENKKATDCISNRRRRIFSGGPGQERSPERILKPEFSLERWIMWYIEQPLIIFPFNQEIVIPHGWTFKTWMEKGYQGRFPTFYDFDQHLKTRWTDFRFRPGYLEYRVIDTVPFPLLMSAAAFIKGLVFRTAGCEAVENITKDWNDEIIREFHLGGCINGLRTKINNTNLKNIADELLKESKKNLKQYSIKNKSGKDESIFLSPIERLLKKEMSPAEDLLEFTKGDSTKIIDWTNKEF